MLRELGISCKNNHEAVKHPRITEVPDFAKEWTKGEFSCSEEFLDKMEKVQKVIEEYQEKYSTWSEVEEKKEKVYLPIVEAFVEEIRRLGMASKEAGDEKMPVNLQNFFLSICLEHVIFTNLSKMIKHKLQQYIHTICMDHL